MAVIKRSSITRESWLQAAIEIFRARFVEVGYPLPETIHVSVGFHSGARAESGKILGVTYKSFLSNDGMPHIFISPEVADTHDVMVVLLHELIHAADDCVSGHKGTFAEIATRLGFDAPMTCTPPSPSLSAELLVIAMELGDYPHSALDLSKAKKPAKTPVGPDGTPIPPVKVSSGPSTQTTRMVKIVCPCCGYSVRTTRKWIEEGLPYCPKGTQMQEA